MNNCSLDTIPPMASSYQIVAKCLANIHTPLVLCTTPSAPPDPPMSPQCANNYDKSKLDTRQKQYTCPTASPNLG